MFTGIIQAIGKVSGVDTTGGDVRLTVDTATLNLGHASIGDSIAVNGVCLTVVEWVTNGFIADVSGETLALTTLGTLDVGTLVNLESSATPTTVLGGHLVQGHADGTAVVVELRKDARSVRLELEVAHSLARYIAVKGAIAIDGVSLTVNNITGHRFGVNVIPHTQEHTTIGGYAIGTRVNIECDMIARYLERLTTSGD